MMPLSPSDANLAMLHLNQQSLVKKKLDMDALRERLHGKPDQQTKLREACEGFESLFIQKLWEQMRKNVQKSGYLHSRDEQMYQGMYDMEFSKKMTQAGGIGLADMLYEQLSQRLGESSRTTSPSNDPRLPIIPASSSVTALAVGPLSLDEKTRQTGIPLNNKNILPLYKDALALHSPAVAPEAPVLEAGGPAIAVAGLAAFDENVANSELAPQATPQQAVQPQAVLPDDDDFEAQSRALLTEELTLESGVVQAASANMPVFDESPLSSDEAALIEAALRQSEALAWHISEAQASLPDADEYARFGTALATDSANPAESAAVSHTNNL